MWTELDQLLHELGRTLQRDGPPRLWKGLGAPLPWSWNQNILLGPSRRRPKCSDTPKTNRQQPRRGRSTHSPSSSRTRQSLCTHRSGRRCSRPAARPRRRRPTRALRLGSWRGGAAGRNRSARAIPQMVLRCRPTRDWRRNWTTTSSSSFSILQRRSGAPPGATSMPLARLQTRTHRTDTQTQRHTKTQTRRHTDTQRHTESHTY